MHEHAALLEDLVNEHGTYLYRYAFRYFGSEQMAEELVQETFLAATDSIARFRGESSYRTWLTGILRFKIFDAFEHQKRESSVNMETSLDELFDDKDHWSGISDPCRWEDHPEEKLTQKHFLAALEKCLAKLPGSVRSAFLLREVEGYDRSDVEKYLGVSTSNAGVLLYRARLSLQQCLQKNWILAPARQGADQ